MNMSHDIVNWDARNKFLGRQGFGTLLSIRLLQMDGDKYFSKLVRYRYANNHLDVTNSNRGNGLVVTIPFSGAPNILQIDLGSLDTLLMNIESNYLATNYPNVEINLPYFLKNEKKAFSNPNFGARILPLNAGEDFIAHMLNFAKHQKQRMFAKQLNAYAHGLCAGLNRTR